jgi:TRAP-type transport system periplasmic protein
MPIQTTRRSLMSGAVTIAILLAASPALAQVTLTLGHGAAPGNPRTVAAEEFARLVSERTSGNVTINIAGSEQLGDDVSMLTSLRTGALDFTANSQGASSGLVPELSAIGLPFLFEDGSQAYELLQGPIGDQLEAKFAELGIEVLDWWDNGLRHTTTSEKAVATPADLSGQTIRTPADPMTVDIFQAMGAATEQIPFGELYIALQQGVVDGQENPLANISSAKLYEVNPYISLTGHKWESTPFLMSTMTAAKVSPEELEIVRQAALEAGEMQRQLMADAATQFLEEFKVNPDLTVTEVDRAAFQEATQSVVEKWRTGEIGPFVEEVLTAVNGG